MKLYFNKEYGAWVCAGNGIAAMDKEKANAIKMALDWVEEDNTKKAATEYSEAFKGVLQSVAETNERILKNNSGI